MKKEISPFLRTIAFRPIYFNRRMPRRSHIRCINKVEIPLENHYQYMRLKQTHIRCLYIFVYRIHVLNLSHIIFQYSIEYSCLQIICSDK